MRGCMKQKLPRPQGVNCNDRILEQWILSCPTGQGYKTRNKNIDIFAHPVDGRRGAETEYLIASYDGVVFKDTDIVRLRERLQEYHIGIKEEDYEKVIVVQTTGERFHSYAKNEERAEAQGGDEFGISWEVCWLVRRLGFIFDITRTYKISQHKVSEFDTKTHDELYDGYIIGGANEPKAIIPWTEAREAALQAAADSIAATRERVQAALKDNTLFARLLDTHGVKMLEAPK